jgi:hypothetical protein
MGPALFFILFFGVFLTLDLIALGFNYCACLTLNDVQLREASKLPAAVAKHPQGPVVLRIPEEWRNTMMGGLANVQDINTTVSYHQAEGNVFVTVTTQVQVRPPLTIPFFPGVPGLGAPVAFNISNSRLTEN